jgi:hypothetical protein
VLFLLNESHWRPWGHLLHTVRTGEPAFEHVHGANLFEYLDKHPEEANLFHQCSVLPVPSSVTAEGFYSKKSPRGAHHHHGTPFASAQNADR